MGEAPRWNLAYLGYFDIYGAMPLSVRLKLWTYPIRGIRNVSRIYAKRINERWNRAGWFNGAFAYAIDHSAAQWIVRENTPIAYEADAVLQRLTRFSGLDCIAERDPSFVTDFSQGSLIGKRSSWH
jgi:hypothetical protein